MDKFDDATGAPVKGVCIGVLDLLVDFDSKLVGAQSAALVGVLESTGEKGFEGFFDP